MADRSKIKPARRQDEVATSPINCALIQNFKNKSFLNMALEQLNAGQTSLLVSESSTLFPQIPKENRLDYATTGFKDIPIQLDQVLERLSDWVLALKTPSIILVDMSWGVDTVSASANFEFWGIVCHRLMVATNCTVVSLYNIDILVEDQLLTALRGHSHFIAPSGVYENPFWLPPEYLNGATLSEQVAYLLGRVVPDYADLGIAEGARDGAATGADPGWIAAPQDVRPKTRTSEIWKIRCFGRLRIYKADGSQLQWKIPGGSPRKSKVLFAYLLQRGERGARADQIAELLWPDEQDEAVKRARLHHTVTMLRRTLGGTKFIVRTGEYYSLVPPEGSWIDISSFQQFCHRSKVLGENGQNEEALKLLKAAERLYSGDLFEDLLPKYIESDVEDWCIPQRAWLREMALKVQCNMAVLLRLEGHLREALECCQKAISMDPVCEVAHAEAMRIFHAQGRPEAVARQHRQFCAALEAIGVGAEADELEALSRELSKVK